jgi:uncharacterized protein YkwD
MPGLSKKGWLMRRRFAVCFAALLISIALLVPGASETALAAKRRPRPISCSDTEIQPTRSNLALVDRTIRCLIDRERTRRGLRALQPNRDLQRLASSQANEMVIGEYFGDDSLAGQTPWQRVTSSHYASGARSVSLGQNIGWGTGALATPAAIMSAWMHSPEHRHITLTAGYRDIGVGVAPSPPRSQEVRLEGATYTVEFAARG